MRQRSFIFCLYSLIRVFAIPASHQVDHSGVEHVAERAAVCEQSAARGETCGPGPLHPAPHHCHGCYHLQPLVRASKLLRIDNISRDELTRPKMCRGVAKDYTIL